MLKDEFFFWSLRLQNSWERAAPSVKIQIESTSLARLQHQYKRVIRFAHSCATVDRSVLALHVSAVAYKITTG